MGSTWGPSGADRSQVGPMLAPWTLLSETVLKLTQTSNVCKLIAQLLHKAPVILSNTFSAARLPLLVSVTVISLMTARLCAIMLMSYRISVNIHDCVLHQTDVVMIFLMFNFTFWLILTGFVVQITNLWDVSSNQTVAYSNTIWFLQQIWRIHLRVMQNRISYHSPLSSAHERYGLLVQCHWLLFYSV